MSGGMSSGSRYGGFGNEDSGSYGGYSGGVYGDGGGFGGNTSGFQDSGRKDRFEEYDEFDDGAMSSPPPKKSEPGRRSSNAKVAEPPKPKEPEVDILGFDDDIPPETPPKEFGSTARQSVSGSSGNGLGSMQASGADDDEFDDFQSATPTTTTTSHPSIPNLPPPITTSTAAGTQYAAPKPVVPSQGANINDLVGFNSISPAPSATSSIALPPSSNYNISSPPASAFASPSLVQPQQPNQLPRPTGYQAAAPNYFTSVQVPTPASQPSSTPGSKPSAIPTNSFSKPATKPSASGGDAFGSLWSAASANAGIKKPSTPGNNGPNLASMQKQKAAAGIWGAPAANSTAPMQPMQHNGQNGGGALDDLLG